MPALLTARLALRHQVQAVIRLAVIVPQLNSSPTMACSPRARSCSVSQRSLFISREPEPGICCNRTWVADSGAAKSVLCCKVSQRSRGDCADPAAGKGGALGGTAAPCGLWARPHGQAPPHQLPPCASTAHTLRANPGGEHSLNASLDACIGCHGIL